MVPYYPIKKRFLDPDILLEGKDTICQGPDWVLYKKGYVMYLCEKKDDELVMVEIRGKIYPDFLKELCDIMRTPIRFTMKGNVKEIANLAKKFGKIEVDGVEMDYFTVNPLLPKQVEIVVRTIP